MSSLGKLYVNELQDKFSFGSLSRHAALRGNAARLVFAFFLKNNIAQPPKENYHKQKQ